MASPAVRNAAKPRVKDDFMIRSPAVEHGIETCVHTHRCSASRECDEVGSRRPPLLGTHPSVALPAWRVPQQARGRPSGRGRYIRSFIAGSRLPESDSCQHASCRLIPGGWADTSARSAGLSYATAMESCMRFDLSSRMPAALSRARAACARHFSTFRLRAMAQSLPWAGCKGKSVPRAPISPARQGSRIPIIEPSPESRTRIG